MVGKKQKSTASSWQYMQYTAQNTSTVESMLKENDRRDGAIDKEVSYAVIINFHF